ncbi:Transcription factor TFIIB [Cinnamomum micranthum f. kanehirae]|uniref:Transcription factor TFIIB n=1 Tax=Cinnamomum micranthum f. kanehirae TaxID=337451 RepID=A0A443NID7_9MAGN|nr:Transcription factor TFIIB [Cinnamomum micranthum f. kanehirae]
MPPNSSDLCEAWIFQDLLLESLLQYKKRREESQRRTAAAAAWSLELSSFMETSCPCNNCKERTVVFDSTSSTYVCSSCSVEQSGILVSHLEGSFNAPLGTFIRIGASEYNYRDKKRFDAQNQINDVASSLGLSSQHSDKVYHIIQQITNNEFGIGNWFSILIAACFHVVIRQNCLPLSISEIAAVTRFDVHEIGRMVTRVTEFLGLNIPKFDVVASFERTIKSCNCLSRVPAEKLDLMFKQGRFLLQCCVKWFLMTGRQPMPIIAAVSLFVAEVNEVNVRIEDIAKEIYTGVNTSKMRYKELKETLIKVAQSLPWGKDVVQKNLVKNAPLILRYMAMKSKQDSKNSGLDSKELIQFNLQDIVSECTRKEDEYDMGDYLVKNDSQYISVKERNGLVCCDDLRRLKLSEDCLWQRYVEYLNGVSSVELTMRETVMAHRQKRKRGGMIPGCEDWWVKNSELKKKVSLDQILERNVGLDALPPSFVAGMEARKRRREKINSAKLRIGEIIQPAAAGLDGGKVVSSLEKLEARKEWKQGFVDSEDCIIELLLLLGANEEQVEQGHYNTLLDLHFFNSVGGERFAFHR